MANIWRENLSRLNRPKRGKISRIVRPPHEKEEEGLLTNAKGTQVSLPNYSEIPNKPGVDQYYGKFRTSNSDTGTINQQWLTNKFYPGFLESRNDRHTLAPLATKLDSAVESSVTGYPFYFKDLRDGTYIVFRGYISGLTENITGEWNSETFVGRSEPVHVYQQGQRTISFTLKLFALSVTQLDAIYGKLNRLTSLCYPDYMSDSQLHNKVRMKPPMTKFRLGELFGNSSEEMLGFIESISNVVPDNSPWEHAHGRRVPKHVESSITYRVLHASIPNIDTRFYGYDTTTQAAHFQEKAGELPSTEEKIINAATQLTT